jgi:hypothetical protein
VIVFNFYTPRPVVRFMVEVTDPRLGENNTAVASNPAASAGVVRRETGIRFDRLTLVFSSAGNGAALGGLVGIPVFIAWHLLLQDIHGESFSLLPNWMAAGAVLGAIGNIWWRLSGMTLTEAQLVDFLSPRSCKYRSRCSLSSAITIF